VVDDSGARAAENPDDAMVVENPDNARVVEISDHTKAVDYEISSPRVSQATAAANRLFPVSIHS